MIEKIPKIAPTLRGPALTNYKNQLVLTQTQREIAIGVLLGDASLNTQDSGKSYRLKFEQGIHHLLYIKHLHNAFDPWCLLGVYLVFIRASRKIENKFEQQRRRNS